MDQEILIGEEFMMIIISANSNVDPFLSHLGIRDGTFAVRVVLEKHRPQIYHYTNANFQVHAKFVQPWDWDALTCSLRFARVTKNSFCSLFQIIR